jgi:hypothetical protein
MKPPEYSTDGTGVVPLNEIPWEAHFLELILSKDLRKEPPFILKDLRAKNDNVPAQFFLFFLKLHIKRFREPRSGAPDRCSVFYLI